MLAPAHRSTMVPRSRDPVCQLDSRRELQVLLLMLAFAFWSLDDAVCANGSLLAYTYLMARRVRLRVGA